MLIDREGRVLLQHRDDAARVAPNQWGLVGGAIEPGEAPEDAARRELLEEAGLRVDEPLVRYWHGELPPGIRPGVRNIAHVFYAPTRFRDADIVLGEGRAIVFVAAGEIPALDLSLASSAVLPRFLASTEYAATVRTLRREAP